MVYVCVSGSSSLWDDCERLLKEGPDDARPDPRMLCGLQSSGWVITDLIITNAKKKGHNGSRTSHLMSVPPTLGRRSLLAGTQTFPG